MKLLLDTHAFLWAVLAPQQLSPRARALLEDPDNALLVSAVSAWEIATKYRLGKLDGASALIQNYPHALAGLQATELPMQGHHALKAGSYLQAHRDPFDRMLAAQAEIEGLPLLSRDPALAAFGVEVLW